MNCIASIAAVIGLCILPMQASFQSGYVVIEHSICGASGTERGVTRVPRNRRNPVEHDPSQSMSCAHALRPDGLPESDDACEDAGEN
jgi:hypothetical protein